MQASVGTIKTLVEVSLDSVLLYGIEVWGCTRQLGLIENVQIRAATSFTGVGKLHQLVSPQFEMCIFPLKWRQREGE